MSTADKLREARALIEDPAHWCKNINAANIDGHECQVLSTSAVKFCAEGARWRVLGHWRREFAAYALIKAAQDLGYKDVIDLNDDSNHATVMKMFDCAIELASAEKAR